MNFQFILSLVAAIFIGGAAGYLGSLMITKKMVLVGGPLGHLALPGVALALIYHYNIFLGALLSIAVGAAVIWFLGIKTKLSMEALTGVVFAAGVALGFLILPLSRAEEALIGDITKINLTDAVLAIILGTTAFFVIKKIYSKMILSGISEDLAQTEGINVKKYNFIYLICIALIVALEVKIVGVLFTVALLVIPAAASRNFSGTISRYSWGALIIGIVSAILGILIFKFINLPAGPLIILTGTFIFLISLFFKK
jgi:ABC-type Mn2+/Zn2+ transport system permease subunit